MKIEKLANTCLVVLGLCIAAASAGYAEEAHAADAGPAAAQPAVTSPSVAAPDLGADPVAWAEAVYGAVRGGQWALAAGLVLIGLTYASRRWVLTDWGWAQSDRGGVFTAGALALLGALATALLAGKWPDWRTLLAALQVALVAMGGYVGIRKALWPKKTPAGATP